MIGMRRYTHRTRYHTPAFAPVGRPGAVVGMRQPAAGVRSAGHALSRTDENNRLYEYEKRVKSSFDAIVPALKRISAMQHEEDFEIRAQQIAREQLGFELPQQILADAWIDQLDMRRLFAWCMFETYQRFCNEFFMSDPLSEMERDFQLFIQECGFHTLDISPCADGRLAHVIRYVLRLPYREVRRRSYAGAMFDIEDSLAKWTEVELTRFREGRPNTADAPTRYLKMVVYHFSSVDPAHEGCAAHGSNDAEAARQGLERLYAFQQAVQNSHCCGASIDLLLVGLDTDTDAIRVHVPDANGEINLEMFVDAREVYEQTARMQRSEAELYISGCIRDVAGDVTQGMQKLVARLLINNFSQVDYVRQYFGDHYEDIGHAERFIGAGIGFEEVQLRNLTYFAYMQTVEEAASDLDVGIKIFSRLNVSRGLPVPVVVRFDYHGSVPGARERAMERCARVANALYARYPDLAEKGLLHTLLAIRDCSAGGVIEVLDSSVNQSLQQEAH